MICIIELALDEDITLWDVVFVSVKNGHNLDGAF